MKLLLIFCLIAFKVATSFPTPPPVDSKFINAHTISQSEFVKAGLNTGAWDRISQTRGTETKPVNTFIVGDYKTKILPATQNNEKIPSLPGDRGLFVAQDGLRTVTINRNENQKIVGLEHKSNQKVIVGMAASNDGRGNVPVHLEGGSQQPARVILGQQNSPTVHMTLANKGDRVLYGTQNANVPPQIVRDPSQKPPGTMSNILNGIQTKVNNANQGGSSSSTKTVTSRTTTKRPTTRTTKRPSTAFRTTTKKPGQNSATGGNRRNNGVGGSSSGFGTRGKQVTG